MRKAFVVLTVLFALQNIGAQNYYYHEKTDTREANLVYQNYRGQDRVITGFYIYSPITEQAHEILLDAKFATVKWTNTKSDGTKDIYSRNGEQITAEVTRDGKQVTVKRNIDAAPWYASMEYGLGQFFRSGKQSVEFWNILPDNLKAYKMKAEILAKEKIPVDGIPTDTLKVQVTIKGIPALFFHFMYWFRESDGFFVRFEGAKGVPGTPLTTMIFTREE